MKKSTIIIRSICNIPEIQMTITIPGYRDEEEYIDEVLDEIFSDDYRYSIDWEFVY